MLKKARLDKTKNQNDASDDGSGNPNQIYDRNELLKIMKGE
jgi:hypothetical protein